ncbi:MAG: phenylalanine--tRNA ligase subunit alpha [Thermoproteota archaeon]|nr:phenylalanine--tRNA ligase subunit alpha [Thermoproteota archaeon]
MSVNANDEERDRLSSTTNLVKESIASLHPIEKKILSILYDDKEKWFTDNELTKESKLSIDQIRRGIEWLKFKNFIAVEDSTEFEISLKGPLKENYGFYLPERKLVNCVREGKSGIVDIIKSEAFNNNSKEVYSAIKHCKNNKWVDLKNNSVFLLPASEYLSNEERLVNKLAKLNSLTLSELNESEVSSFEILKKRPNVLDIKKIKNKKYIISDLGVSFFKELNSRVELERKLTAEHLVNGAWRNLEFEQIDVEAPLALLGYGKKNPLVDFIDEVKEILVGMGFSEIDGNFAQSSFWNFDALFIPQDHSARDMQDTFYLKTMKNIDSPLPEYDIIKNVSIVHEKNWNYAWDIEESKPYVLRTHTTPVTIQYLAKEKPEQAKTFLIGRVFRNEKVSFKHLVEFNQIEGIFTGKDANLRQLMAIQTEFYTKMGVKRIKFWPTFFPYTEPSLQSMIYNDKFGKWIELFGMGILRPEVTLPLGIKNPVLAWGGGFERLAMIRFNLDDIRELYNNNLTWLKSVPKCLL